jgi:hypothetical protein
MIKPLASHPRRIPVRLPFVPLLTVLGTLSSLAAAGADGEGETGFVALGNGHDMNGFAMVGAPASTWIVEDGTIKCSGVPTGYFATGRSYRNFVLRLDFRYVRPADLLDDATFPGNTGYLCYISGEPKVWPRCVEVQGRNRDVGRILALGGVPPVASTDNPAARKEALRPVGEWNSLEIISQDGALTAVLNGTTVCTSAAGELREGPIGFQSEGREVHFRHLRIKELP